MTKQASYLVLLVAGLAVPVYKCKTIPADVVNDHNNAEPAARYAFTAMEAKFALVQIYS